MATRPPLSRVLCLGATLVSSSCLAPSARPAPSPTPELRPERFFAGHTHGEGTLALRGRSPQTLRVEGHGRADDDSTFQLDQTLTIGGTVETRTWRLHRVDARRYTATLSDARGPVTAEVDGNRFHLRYRIRWPDVMMEQWLYLQPDGRRVRNVATITVLGVPWGRLDEAITRDAPVTVLR